MYHFCKRICIVLIWNNIGETDLKIPLAIQKSKLLKKSKLFSALNI